jgi:LmbE family N-acetylglucosaminyl deacetylase
MSIRQVALAIAAHPDDIEFSMAGTLLLLRERSWEIHYLNLASGHCGSAVTNSAETRRVRRREAQASARLLGARFHPSFLDDLEIFYRDETLRKLTSLVRLVQPAVVLTHSPQDYMEDHMTTARLAVTASFARGMRNYRTRPMRAAVDQSVTLYHAMPHGLCDGLGEAVIPGAFVNTTRVHSRKREALGCHLSQKHWLDVSQGMDSYLHAMDTRSKHGGKMSRRYTHAEGWRRHSHLGFCAAGADPLRDVLQSDYQLNTKGRSS